MRIFITGICGFAGAAIARALKDTTPGLEIAGIDNFLRPGSDTNRAALRAIGADVRHGDVRMASDFDGLPPADWIIDAAANPSVLAGVDGHTSSRQLVEHNLLGTVNMLETARRWRAGVILLSTSRVYSIAALAALPVSAAGDAFALRADAVLPPGVSADGINEACATSAPVSLYGATKLASEVLALEYGDAFGLPVWVDRCGVLAGAGQFGRADQGIFSFWIHAHRARRPLRYLGFGGTGWQVRDCLHPQDLAALLHRQMAHAGGGQPRIVNVSGGTASAMSLRQLTAWCDARFGAHVVAATDEERPYDLPWVVLDATKATSVWQWRPEHTTAAILEEIAQHAIAHPNWLDVSAT